MFRRVLSLVLAVLMVCAPMAGQACGKACPVEGKQPQVNAGPSAEVPTESPTDAAEPCAFHDAGLKQATAREGVADDRAPAGEANQGQNFEVAPHLGADDAACAMASGCALGALPMVFLPRADVPAAVVTGADIDAHPEFWTDRDPPPFFRPPRLLIS